MLKNRKTIVLWKKKDLYKLTDEELLVEKNKLRKSKLWYATWIGFLAGILIFGVVAWSLNPEKQLGFLIPMFFPAFFIYKLLKASNKNKDLEDVLKERGLNWRIKESIEIDKMPNWPMSWFYWRVLNDVFRIIIRVWKKLSTKANRRLAQWRVQCFVWQFCGRFKCSSSIELLCYKSATTPSRKTFPAHTGMNHKVVTA